MTVVEFEIPSDYFHSVQFLDSALAFGSAFEYGVTGFT